MKSRETLIRLKKFQVDEKRRRVTQIEGMIADFQRMSVDLEREIQTEQERAGINDPGYRRHASPYRALYLIPSNRISAISLDWPISLG